MTTTVLEVYKSRVKTLPVTDRLLLARTFNTTTDFRAIPYGPSSVAPSEPQEMERYFERLDKVGAVGKQPDLLIMPKGNYEAIQPQDEAIAAMC